MSLRTSTWIHLYGDAFTNKKISAAVAALTRGGVHKMVGHLGALWTWAMEFAQEGDLGHVSDVAIAQGAGWPKAPWRFVAALLEAGLLDPDRRLHDWDTYAGRLIRKRQADAARKRVEYERKKKPKPPSPGLRWSASGDHAESPMEKAARDMELISG
jgi:hypothetical protein